MTSIIIPWRDREEIATSAPFFMRLRQQLGVEIVIVCAGGCTTTLKRHLGEHISSFCILDLGVSEFFHKTLAHNLGASFARSDELFFCDCDIIIEREIMEQLLLQLHSRSGCFVTIAGVIETQKNARVARNVTSFGYELRITLANGRSLTIVDSEEDAITGARNAPGLLFVRRSHFLEVNGYNSRLKGWGWEDQDMISRLTLSAGLSRLQVGVVSHISHSNYARTQNYEIKDQWLSRDQMFRQALAYYDDGDLMGTFGEDVRRLGLDSNYRLAQARADFF